MSGYDDARKRAIEAIQSNRLDASLWKQEDRTITIEFFYPRIDDHINELKLQLSDVRASDGIKIHYDFERDGYVVMQPYTVEVDMGDYIDVVDHWEETGFFQSWALEDKNQTLDNNT